jgi:uncharacterized Tic20 family protein
MTMPPNEPGPPGGAYQAGPGAGAPYGPTSDERTWALVAHIGTLVAAWFAMGFLCPLIVMLTKGNESAFVRRHSVESLNFQISLLIYLVVSGILVLLVVGIFMLIALGIFALVVIIQATMAASNGREYRYPLCIRLVS